MIFIPGVLFSDVDFRDVGFLDVDFSITGFSSCFLDFESEGGCCSRSTDTEKSTWSADPSDFTEDAEIRQLQFTITKKGFGSFSLGISPLNWW